MSDEQKNDAAQDTNAEKPKVNVKVEDAGTLRKKVTIEVEREKIDAKYNEMFGELSKSAMVPGFRIGHAPKRLIEKRFGKEVGEDVRNSIVSEALGAGLEQEKLQMVGEPELKIEEIKIPDEGPLSFSFEVEVAPEFELPQWKGLEIKKPTLEVDDARVTQTLENYRRAYAPVKVTHEPAAENDVVVADVKVAGDGIELDRQDVPMRVGPFQIEGILLENLGKKLTGAKAGDTKSLKTTVPQPHPNEAWRGKEVTVTVTVKEVKRPELPEFEAVATQAGYANVEELRAAVRQRMESEAVTQQHEAMHAQVLRYLLANTTLDVPEGVSKRHARTLLARRYVDLLYRGVPREQIEQNLEVLSEGATKQALDESKLSFILGKIANQENIDVDEAEANARIAQIAAKNNRRPERVRQELHNEGRLEDLYIAIRDDKVVEKILAEAKIVDVTPEQMQAEQAAQQAETT